jgi:hypothetical protein
MVGLDLQQRCLLSEAGTPVRGGGLPNFQFARDPAGIRRQPIWVVSAIACYRQLLRQFDRGVPSRRVECDEWLRKDMSLAEDFCRRGKLSGALKRDLQFHAELLKRMNRPQEAQAKLDEAAKL